MPSNPFAKESAHLEWQEPLEAYRRLRTAGLQPILLAGAGAHPEARWSFVAFDPVLEVRLDGDSFEERWADGAIEAGTAEPLAYLRALTERFHFSADEGRAPFTGGWAGFFGFGFANLLEPSLPAPRGRSGPDAILRLCRGALAFDRESRSLHAFAADLDGEAAAATERLARCVRALTQPLAAASPAPAPAQPWRASLDQMGFEQAAARIRALVHGGDLFQANLATRFSSPLESDPADLFRHLLQANPSPFMALLEFDGLAIASGSPEQLFAVRGGMIRSRPIAGTRKRGADAEEDARMERELLADAKEQAEHTMLVDLVRNDVARVSVPGSVHVPERGSVERYRHVMHLASAVEGTLRPGTGFVDWLAALFPGGTVTGAPKVRATQRILEAEPVPRGPYTGSAGYLSWSHNAAWNILIRTLVLQDGSASVHAGSGIVADSVPAAEWREAGRKAQALLDAATGTGVASDPGRLGEVTRHAAWSPPAARARHADARVLLIDNYDSFVHNLADHLAALGAATHVVRNDADWRAALRVHRATHVVLSPGPGWPAEAGCTPEVVRALHGTLPILGVCLGHQAIGEAHGAQVAVKGPVHGKPDLVHHNGEGLFTGLPTPLEAARYHSLVVSDTLGPDWHVDARLADGTVMAIRHATHPTHGLQFHPESLCTPLGLELLDRFLAAEPLARRREEGRPTASPTPGRMATSQG